MCRVRVPIVCHVRIGMCVPCVRVCLCACVRVAVFARLTKHQDQLRKSGLAMDVTGTVTVSSTPRKSDNKLTTLFKTRMASAAAPPPLPPIYQEKVDALKKANESLRSLVSRQQQLSAQLTENSMVKEVRSENRLALGARAPFSPSPHCSNCYCTRVCARITPSAPPSHQNLTPNVLAGAGRAEGGRAHLQAARQGARAPRPR